MSDATPVYVGRDPGAAFPLDTPLWRHPGDGTPLLLSPGPGLTPNEIDTGERSLWRYARALRVAAADAVSLGEGWTPLVATRWHDAPVHFKLEYFAPSGSFKDRGSTVMLTYLKGCGVHEILEDSSGNAGASIATYAAAAGIRCRILVPAYTSAGKTVPMAFLGAQVVKIEGSREDTAQAARQQAETIFYASHNWQPFFLEGTKTLAFELWEQLGFTAPDNVVMPVGYGSNLLGCYFGFRELLERGQIGRLPRLFAVQAAHVAPLDAAFRAGADDLIETTVQPTIADGIAASRPVRMPEMLGALRATHGATVAVSEADILVAVTELAQRGFFVEPTCATAAVGFDHLLRDGVIQRSETTVVILTGTGLKTVDKFASMVDA